MKEIIEIMARAIMEAKGGCLVKDWEAEERDNPNVALAVKQARAAVTALKAAGYAIVPVEPSEAMIEAGTWDNWDNKNPHYATESDIESAWERMIQAAGEQT